MYTTVNPEGLLNNYAKEPKTYYAAYPSTEQQRNYVAQGAIVTLFVTVLVLFSSIVS
jgi:hypothetical protein